MTRIRTQRKTDNVHLLKGTHQPVRHGRPNEKPPVPAGRPRCPQWLPPYGKAEWKRIIPLLDEMGILSKTDQSMITQYCSLFAEFKTATMNKRYREVITKGGDIYKVLYPFSPQEHGQFRQCQQQLGLTVLARQSIKMPKGKKSNRFEGL